MESGFDDKVGVAQSRVGPEEPEEPVETELGNAADTRPLAITNRKSLMEKTFEKVRENRDAKGKVGANENDTNLLAAAMLDIPFFLAALVRDAMMDAVQLVNAQWFTSPGASAPGCEASEATTSMVEEAKTDEAGSSSALGEEDEAIGSAKKKARTH